ncbi:hypothetical protein GOL29_03180 [Sinorhizobium medicae]|nr:hypothetical protein [Sinorhizobium medicae]
MKRVKSGSLFERGAGLYFRKPVKATCRVVGMPKPWTLAKLNDLQRRVNRE